MRAEEYEKNVLDDREKNSRPRYPFGPQDERDAIVPALCLTEAPRLSSPAIGKKGEWLAVAGPEDATLQVVGVLKRLARDCLLTTQSETREYLRRSTSRNQQFPDCRDAGVIRTVKVDYIYPPLRPSGSLQILTHGHGQITRATAGIRRKAAVAPQLSTSVPRNATDPFARAGSAAFRSAYCSQLTKA